MVQRGGRIGAVLGEKGEKEEKLFVGGWCDDFLCGYCTARTTVRTYGRVEPVNSRELFTW